MTFSLNLLTSKFCSIDIFLFLLTKVDKIYLSTPTKIAILDHEKKRTLVLRKDGLPDAGEVYFLQLFY